MPTQIPQVEEISFTTEDGAKLVGTLFLAQGDLAVVLAHMGDYDQQDWHPFARAIASRGISAITFNFRCYEPSECVTGEGDLGLDVRAAIEVLRERGFSRIACIGGSMGGLACMNAALREELVGLGVLASFKPRNYARQYPQDLVSPTMPKLFVFADRDSIIVPDMYSLYEISPEPKTLYVFPGAVHGTELFKTEYGGMFKNLLLNFLDGLRVTRSPANTPIPPAVTPESVSPTLGASRTRPADGMVMVYIPAGEFLMGSDDKDRAADVNEKPQHSVYLDAFWVDRTEVTVAQFRAFVRATGYRTTAEQGGRAYAYAESTGKWEVVHGANWQHPFGPDSNAVDDHPVVQVAWSDAAAYCTWAGGSLPSEAQWEKAARGTDGRLYPWGDAFDGTKLNYCDSRFGGDLGDTAYDDGYRYTAPAGSYPAGASPYGALDMAGNVWEWTADWYNRAYYVRSPVQNPAGPAAGRTRVLRGGSWNHSWDGMRAACRLDTEPDTLVDNFGFRCILPAEN